MSAGRFPTARYRVARSGVADGYVATRGGVLLPECHDDVSGAVWAIATDAEDLRLVAYEIEVTP